MSNSRIINDNIAPIEGSLGICWSSIIAGTLSAIAISLMLLSLGAGLDLAAISPWHNLGASITNLAVGSIVWLIIMQWVSSGFGGYITGRVRKKLRNVHENEVFFRDTVQGFLTWAIATILISAFFTSLFSSAVGGGMRDMKDHNESTEYYVDSLFRSESGVKNPAPNIRMEVTHVLLTSIKNGEVTVADRKYLESLVAANTGLSKEAATERVDEVITQEKHNLHKIRKAAASFSIFMSLAMLIGAFIACISSALGGKHKDQHNF